MANEFITTEDTAVLAKLIREIVNDPSTYRGSKYLPTVERPARKIRADIVEASGGLTNPHVPGTNPSYIQSFGTRTLEFEPPQYKEAIHYDEKKILYLRELGQNDPSKRGIKQYIDLDADRLNRRLEARIESERWNAIFNGGISWMGKTISFGVPSANALVPVGAVWSTDGINANNSADPIKDLRYWLMGGSAVLRKYKVTAIVMNPNTARWLLDNTNTQALVKTYFSAENFGPYEINRTLQMLLPGIPMIDVYDGWYQEETIDANGKISVGNATYFVPDGKIYFEVSLPDNDAIGEFTAGLHLATGSIEAPGYGKFFVVEDNLAPGTQGGPKNPFMDLVAGVYGGPALFRGFDTITASVV